ncbi:hypothetical protein HCN44_001067 [Aphidius gifuensis]|uniref:Gustatory receptor n=1 Tax=Aphidius gifuensis TaxID=684658 RepID=A0A834XNI7_APHGI|nr:hypothetical protein HCN44_001067 [Aphidius gifuensis]
MLNKGQIKVNYISSQFNNKSPDKLSWMIYYFFKIFGLAPICIKKLKFTNTNNKVLNFKKTHFDFLYIILLITMALPLSYICIQSVEEKHKTENVNSKTEHNLRLYTIIAGLSVMFIIWFSTVLNQDDAIKLLSQITTTDAGLNMYNDIYKLESSYWHIKLIFIIKFIMWIALGIFVYVIYKNIKVWIIVILPNFIIIWYIMQYGFILIMLENRFKSLNKAFIKLSKGQVQPFIIKTVRSEIYDDNDFVSDRFFVLRQAYTMYSEVCKKLSNYYSFPLLFSMGWFSCEIIYCSYYIILSFLFPDSTKSKAKLFVLFYWIIIETVPIIILTNNVTKIMNEMKATSGIVYIILAQSTVFDKIQNELNAFGLELLHKKISFSAYGIFSLDNQLLQSISGTVVTYLVILIQFQMSLKKNKS